MIRVLFICHGNMYYLFATATFQENAKYRASTGFRSDGLLYITFYITNGVYQSYKK